MKNRISKTGHAKEVKTGQKSRVREESGQVREENRDSSLTTPFRSLENLGERSRGNPDAESAGKCSPDPFDAGDIAGSSRVMDVSRIAEPVAEFGEARLERIGGRIVLRGGSMTDRMEALEWLAMFMPDAVPSLRE